MPRPGRVVVQKTMQLPGDREPYRRRIAPGPARNPQPPYSVQAFTVDSPVAWAILLIRRRRMKAPRTRWSLGIAFVALAAACVGARTGPAGSPGPAGAPPDFEEIFRARADSARMSYTDADVRFMTGMIGHHAQALVMADLAGTHDASPAIRTLAARITNAQKDEIATMQQWLRERGEPVPEVHIDGLQLMVHGAEHAHMMPGMLTQEELEALDRTRGAAFDRLFLESMIRHHQGAVTMVHELFATDGAAQDEAVFKFASDVQVDQTTEVARMQRMLEAMSAAGAR